MTIVEVAVDLRLESPGVVDGIDYWVERLLHHEREVSQARQTGLTAPMWDGFPIEHHAPSAGLAGPEQVHRRIRQGSAADLLQYTHANHH